LVIGWKNSGNSRILNGVLNILNKALNRGKKASDDGREV
jgi:hypothetical protein